MAERTMSDPATATGPDTPQRRRTLGFLLRESSRLMRRRFVYHARKAGLALNQSEASLLVQVSHEPGINQAGAANLLDMETISIVRLVDCLEQAGLLERRRHPTDRRVRTLWLTAAGETTVAQVRAIGEIVRSEALAGIADAERECLLDLLLAIQRNLSSVSDGASGDGASLAVA
ncbi:MAG: MarR family winged helix-turn-helix transcriptional regulator [Acetobacteraceae bacterium]